MVMKMNKKIISTPVGLIALLTAFLLTLLGSDPNSVLAYSRDINNLVLSNQVIDPCDLIPPGGR
jgi:hypothetical protein